METWIIDLGNGRWVRVEAPDVRAALIKAQEREEAMEDAALKIVFETQMNQALAQTAGAGIGGATGGQNGAGGQQVGDAATISADPRLFPQAGTQGVSTEPSPDAGFNTTAPRGGSDNGLEPNI